MHRFCSLIVLLLFMLNGPLNAATHWSRGVSAEAGWQDFRDWNFASQQAWQTILELTK